MSDCLFKACDLNSEDKTPDLIHEDLQTQISALLNTSTAKHLMFEGKLAELCKYIKDNLSNSIRELLFDMKHSGELENIITDTVLTAVKKVETKTSYYVTPQMYGATGNGITDDTLAFQKAVDDPDVSCIIIPNGTYKITKEIIINRESLSIIGGVGGIHYGNIILQCSGCNGFNIVGGSRFITIAGFEIRGESMDRGCGIRFTGGKTVTKLAVRDMHINIFKYGIANGVDDGANYDTVLWNCEFDNIHFYSGDLQCQYSIYLSNHKSQGDNFGLRFNNIFFGHSMTKISHVKGVFDHCNFGIINGTTIEFASCYLTFNNCNFECDEKVSSDYIMKFGTMTYTFENCQFVIRGEDNLVFFKPTSSTRCMEFKNCYVYNYDDNKGAFWGSVGSEIVENCAIRFTGFNPSLLKANFTSGFYQSTVVDNFGVGLPVYNDMHTSTENMERTPYYSVNRGQVEVIIDGDKRDVLGNEIGDYGSFPAFLGNGLVLDGGEVDISDNPDTVTCMYNHQKDGYVFVSCPPIVDGVPIMVYRDVSADYKDKPKYAVFRVKMWDASNQVWVNNTHPFTLKWMKLSFR